MFIKSEIVSIPIEKKKGKNPKWKNYWERDGQSNNTVLLWYTCSKFGFNKGLNKYNKRFVMTFIAHGKCQIQVDNNIVQIRT